MTGDPLLQIAEEVRSARAAGWPVIALESTVITHGMAWPDNLEVVKAMRAAAEEEGAFAAVAAVVDGRMRLGLSDDELDRFARAPRDSIAKCSRRDLPSVLAAGGDGSLTVAGTMLVAQRAGVRIFATGGIGGVHRHDPIDVSADLLELMRTPVAVVCAGAKSILDLPRTLEVLETHGVPVIGYGTATLPAFFCRDSGLPLPASAASLDELTAVYSAWRNAGLDNGLLITVPVPEEQAVDNDLAEAWITQAVEEADARNIRGAAVTPYVLERVAALSEGRTLAANKALLINNARVAARLAVRASG